MVLEFSLSPEGWLELTKHMELSAPGETPALVLPHLQENGNGNGDNESFQWREWLYWEKGPPELNKGTLHTTPKILLLGLEDPVPLFPRQPLLSQHCLASKMEERRNYTMHGIKYLSPQAMFRKIQYTKRCS